MSVRETIASHYAKAQIIWEQTHDDEFPYRARYGDDELTLRLNDFPDEPTFTLFINGEEATDYEDWSTAWSEVETNLAAV